jgi:hypothetical protein
MGSFGPVTDTAPSDSNLQMLRVLVLCLLAASLAVAQDDPVVPPEDSPIVDIVDFQGRIVALDSVFRRITVRNAAGTIREFTLPTTAPIRQHWAQINYQDLQPNDPVVVTYQALPFRIHQVDKL